MADNVASGVTSEDAVGFGELHDLGGVIFEDEAEDLGEGAAISGVVAEERGGANGPGDLFRGWFLGEPVFSFEDGKDIRGGEGIRSWFEFGRFGRVHWKSLAWNERKI